MDKPAPDNLVFDDVVIDFAGRRLLRAGGVQALEPKAFAVLALLGGAPGRVFTRDEILDAVWGHRHVTPGVLNRVMTLLRHALGEDAQSPHYLHTVHGVGYRFDLPAAASPPLAAVLAPEPVIESAPESAPESPPAPAAVPQSAPSPSPSPGAQRQRRAGDAPPLMRPLPAPLPRRRASDWRRSQRFGRLAWIALLLAAAGAAGWALWPRVSPRPVSVPVAPVAPAIDARGIAVLPLADASDDQGQQFFADGISDNLINALSAYDGLKVIGRSSSFRFRDSRDDSRSIGAKLGVAYLLAGSVQRAGNSVRVGVELVHAADGRTLWAQRFDRPYRNLFALQDEIALAVAGALQDKLPHVHGMAGTAETGRPASGNLEAYEAFLHGAHSILRDNRKAIEQFATATRLDPHYAQAWQWLGFVRAISARSRAEGEAERAECRRARNEIETAIRLAPDDGLGYSALAVQMTSCDYDWNGALAQFRKAMPLVPDASPAHGQYSRLLASLGRVRQAIDERRKYLDGDPLTVDGNYWQFLMEAALGRLDAAEASLRRVMALEAPEEVPWYAGNLSYLAILRGDAATALAQARRVPPGMTRDRALALALQIGNRRAEADAALQRLIRTEGDSRFGTYHIARAYALRGDADGMFLWLGRDWQRRGMAAYQLLYDPLLLRFRNDPRFAAFCRTAGLPPPSASDALAIDRIRVLEARRH